MRVEEAVKSMLEAAGVADVFTAPPSVIECAEPVVVGRAAFEGDMELAYGERGPAKVGVLVCREVRDDARDAAYACETALLDVEWERFANVDGARICSVRVGAPAYKERDGSGRYVYELVVLVDVVRGGV